MAGQKELSGYHKAKGIGYIEELPEEQKGEKHA